MIGRSDGSATAHLSTLIGAYALNAVDDIERAAVTRHLATCPSCATEAAELKATAARLAASLTADPPAGLRSQVLAEVSRTRQDSRRRGDDVVAVAVQRWRSATAVAVAACVIAIGGVVAAITAQEHRVGEAREQAAAAQRRADATQVQAQRIAAVLTAPDAKTQSAPLGADGAQMSVVSSVARGELVVVCDRFPTLRGNQVYQAWLLEGARATPGPTMESGHPVSTGLFSAALLTNGGAAQAVAITVEPRGGSPQPTSTPLVAVSLR